MRKARPSTTAVLPTPASPVSIGLFWRRRSRMSTAWRISPSRPITGSSLPSRASCVRSVVNWSSAGVLLAKVASGSSGVSESCGTAALSSPEPAVSLSGWCFNCSTLKRANSFEPRYASCDSSGSVSSANNRWRLRMGPGCAVSSEATSQACSNSSGKWGEKTGVRALPVRKLPISRRRSASSAVRLISLRRAMVTKSLRSCSSSARNRCSISTSYCPSPTQMPAARVAAVRDVSFSLAIRVFK